MGAYQWNGHLGWAAKKLSASQAFGICSGFLAPLGMTPKWIFPQPAKRVPGVRLSRGQARADSFCIACAPLSSVREVLPGERLGDLESH